MTTTRHSADTTLSANGLNSVDPQLPAGSSTALSLTADDARRKQEKTERKGKYANGGIAYAGGRYDE